MTKDTNKENELNTIYAFQSKLSECLMILREIKVSDLELTKYTEVQLNQIIQYIREARLQDRIICLEAEIHYLKSKLKNE